MLLRALFLCLALPVAPARAQDTGSDPGGSLTLRSRPTGAAFRLRGDQVVVGLTPATLQRLVGRYRVESFEPGFENWNRTVTLDGRSADTLWMVLRPQTRAQAALRSALLPGWGQLYSGRAPVGWGYMVGGAAGGAVWLAAHLEYRQRVDELGAIYVDPGAQRRASERAEDAHRRRTVAGAVATGIWALNVVDAAALFPRPRVGGATLELGPTIRSVREPGGDVAFGLGARVRF